jgi:uncharacterized membrane protein
LTYNQAKKSPPLHEGLITAMAIGGFLILVGLVFSLNPNITDRISDFFSSMTSTTYPIGSSTSTIYLPAPTNPAAHSALYSVLLQFDIGFGLLQVIILALRLFYHSKTDKIAETVGNMIFWLGAAALVSTILQVGTLQSWFEYWGALIVIVGISFVARAAVYFIKRKNEPKETI